MSFHGIYAWVVLLSLGIDRHLFCLYVVSKYLEVEVPFLQKVMFYLISFRFWSRCNLLRSRYLCIVVSGLVQEHSGMIRRQCQLSVPHNLNLNSLSLWDSLLS